MTKRTKIPAAVAAVVAVAALGACGGQQPVAAPARTTTTAPAGEPRLPAESDAKAVGDEISFDGPARGVIKLISVKRVDGPGGPIGATYLVADVSIAVTSLSPGLDGLVASAGDFVLRRAVAQGGGNVASTALDAGSPLQAKLGVGESARGLVSFDCAEGNYLLAWNPMGGRNVATWIVESEL